MEIEHSFQCPYWWQQTSMLLESSVERQKYSEDCEVCTRQIQMECLFTDEIRSFEIIL